MGSFDLGRAVQVTRVVAAGTPTAYRVSQELLKSYHRQGFAVHVRPSEAPELDHPSLLEGEFSKSDGTRVSAVVRLTPGVPASGYRQTEVYVELSGRVVVGGAKGMFASASMVQRIAREKLEGYLDEVLAGVPPELATPPAASEAPAEVDASQPEPAALDEATREAELARHDSEIARIEAEVLAAEAKLAEKQAEVAALEAEVAAEDAAREVSPDRSHDEVLDGIEQEITEAEAEIERAEGGSDADSEPRNGSVDPLEAVGAFGTAAAEALVSATSDALAAAEALVDAGARVFAGQSSSLTRETDLPPPEPLPPSERPPAPEPLPSAERPPAPEAIPPAAAIPPAGELEERLARVKALFEKELISEEEFRAKKAELLERYL